MSEIADFIDRYFEAATTNGPHLDVTTDDGLSAANERVMPAMKMRAERAGLEFDDLEETMREECLAPAAITVRRILNNLEADDLNLDLDALRAEIQNVIHGGAVMFFLAGVLWEQQRHLPSLET